MRTLGGRYELEQRAGLGGMSGVARARPRAGPDRRGEAHLPALDGDAGSVDRIGPRARSAARLRAPERRQRARLRAPRRCRTGGRCRTS
ncbi:hypothetical protein V2I01_40325 [Micromonospora sp. BRA006-A]|nr:hypothetical protein [Micromonospora sp. BRA006-A]